MPIYEYRCEECGDVLEVRQRMDDPLLETCGDRCRNDDPGARGTGRVSKQFSVTNVGRSTREAPPPPAACGNCPGAGSCAMEH